MRAGQGEVEREGEGEKKGRAQDGRERKMGGSARRCEVSGVGGGRGSGRCPTEAGAIAQMPASGGGVLRRSAVKELVTRVLGVSSRVLWLDTPRFVVMVPGPTDEGHHRTQRPTPNKPDPG
ncbi:hypothetical protein Afil01_14110 [Actinorhabdospora filicis]|uniref:Uncharacterized protein n=1 Tax=Actinorhabdospora filicis TaxID=1785913 RepID=A0A9W6SG96_9ACTN|nr:hypothetical protein Afil01_14110 [Actinorhabdospora filicis]